MQSESRIINHLLFMRPLAFFGTAILFLAYALIAIKTGNDIGFTDAILGALTCAFLTSAAYSLNNIYDIDIDRINKPFRPLPAGKIGIRQAWLITISCYSIAMFIAASINLLFFALVLLMGTFTVLYTLPPFRLKRIWYLASFSISVSRGLLLVLAAWSLAGNITEILPWYIGTISSVFLFGGVITKDISDINGDMQNYILTFPAIYGIDKSIILIASSQIIPFILILIGVYIGIFPIAALLVMILPIYCIYALRTLIVRRYTLTSIESNHISWKHTYIIYMLLHAGLTVSFFI